MSVNDVYDDIINLPHHVSSKHIGMKVSDRAAQFASFAALSGFEASTSESARLTERKVELDEGEKQILDAKISLLTASPEKNPEICITHFVRDTKKAGGKYVSTMGFLKKTDKVGKKLYLTNGQIIDVDNIIGIDSRIFEKTE